VVERIFQIIGRTAEYGLYSLSGTPFLLNISFLRLQSYASGTARANCFIQRYQAMLRNY